jgi:hypothetical protein
MLGSISLPFVIKLRHHGTLKLAGTMELPRCRKLWSFDPRQPETIPQSSQRRFGNTLDPKRRREDQPNHEGQLMLSLNVVGRSVFGLLSFLPSTA